VKPINSIHRAKQKSRAELPNTDVSRTLTREVEEIGEDPTEGGCTTVFTTTTTRESFSILVLYIWSPPHLASKRLTKHGNTAVLDLSLSQEAHGDPVGETHGVKACVARQLIQHNTMHKRKAKRPIQDVGL